MGLTVNNQSMELKAITEYRITHVIVHVKNDNIVIMYDILSNGEALKSDSLSIDNNSDMYALIKGDAYSLLQTALGITGVVS